MNKLAQKVIESDVLWLIENHPTLSDSAIMSILVYGSVK